MVHVKVYKTIDELGKESINSLSNDFYYTYEWFKTLEVSKPFRIIPKYITAYDENEIIAVAPCFIQYTSQYFTLEDAYPMIRRLRKTLNHLGFSYSPPLLCYSPCSFHSNILLEEESNNIRIFKIISRTIDDICKEQRILISSFPYVSEFNTLLMNNLYKFGYHKIPFLLSTYLDIKWSSFDEYLACMKKKIRSLIRRQIKKNRESGITIEQINDFYSLSQTLAELHSNLYFKYRAKASLLHPLFFEKLSEYAKNNVRLFIAKKKDKIIGFSLYLMYNKIWHFYIAGFDYNYITKNDYTYFNIAFYEPIKDAIEEGVKRIHFRPSSLQAKLKRGCNLEKLYLFVKCQNKFFKSIVNQYLNIRYTMEHKISG